MSLAQLYGKNAETYALNYLRQQGLELIKKNFYCKMGEIDLIMQEAACLVFVEVRMRRSQSFGGAAATVTFTKQQKIIKAAQYFLQGFTNNHRFAARFDVLCIDGPKAAITWIKDAFYAN